MKSSLLLVWLASAGAEGIEAPKVCDERLTIERVAAEPDIVTPTGIAVDPRGRVLVIESHTHFRPAGYDGPPADRIRLFEDRDGDGKFDRIANFFEGTRSTMNLAVYRDGSVFVATRAEVFRLFDRDGDGRADSRQPIARLETLGDYPHNGLSGFAFDAAGNVYFGFGENLGADYRLIGTDGTTLSGGGEGGNIYRCRPDGTKLVRFATGFWNPFHLCFDAFGRLFAVDNDPDSRPPCRLLHVVDQGDYGYRFRNGRKGLHPFTAWNGELPGTLPMVAGTGEAPSGVVAYESDLLPADYRGTLLATSWGDHRLEQFRLHEAGASVRAIPRAIVQGGEDFRPVGIAQAPDGSLYISDWVDKSYELHKKGRVWRLRAVRPASRQLTEDVAARVSHPDRRIREEAVHKLAADAAGRARLQEIAAEHADARARSTALQALAAVGGIDPPFAERLLHDAAPPVRRLAVELLPLDLDRLLDRVLHDPSLAVRAAALAMLADRKAVPVLLEALDVDDPFVRQAARIGLERSADVAEWLRLYSTATGGRKVELALLLRQSADPRALAQIGAMLGDHDPQLRFVAVQWVGEQRLVAQRAPLASVLEGRGVTRQLYEAVLAALERLDGVARAPGEEIAGEEYVARLVLHPKTSPMVRQRALRTLRPDHLALTLERLDGFLKEGDAALRLEAVRSLRESPYPGRLERLARLASGRGSDMGLRLEALVGLSPAAPQHRRLLLALAEAPPRPLQIEALRSLRTATWNREERARLERLSQRDPTLGPLVERLVRGQAKDARPDRDELDRWLERLEGPADAAAGGRIFYHPAGPACYRCHQIDGRGGRFGPDLSTIARTMQRRRLVESILLPAKEIAPMFVAWTVATTDGTTFTGTFLGSDADGVQVYADSQGTLIRVPAEGIETRTAAGGFSIMPENLIDTMTLEEFRDLIAYLETTAASQ